MSTVDSTHAVPAQSPPPSQQHDHDRVQVVVSSQAEANPVAGLINASKSFIVTIGMSNVLLLSISGLLGYAGIRLIPVAAHALQTLADELPKQTEHVRSIDSKQTQIEVDTKERNETQKQQWICLKAMTECIAQGNETSKHIADELSKLSGKAIHIKVVSPPEIPPINTQENKPKDP